MQRRAAHSLDALLLGRGEDPGEVQLDDRAQLGTGLEEPLERLDQEDVRPGEEVDVVHEPAEGASQAGSVAVPEAGIHVQRARVHDPKAPVLALARGSLEVRRIEGIRDRAHTTVELRERRDDTPGRLGRVHHDRVGLRPGRDASCGARAGDGAASGTPSSRPAPRDPPGRGRAASRGAGRRRRPPGRWHRERATRARGRCPPAATWRRRAASTTTSAASAPGCAPSAPGGPPTALRAAARSLRSGGPPAPLRRPRATHPSASSGSPERPGRSGRPAGSRAPAGGGRAGRSAAPPRRRWAGSGTR